MSKHLTRDQILARVTGRGTCTLADGSTIGIRGLTRDEVIQMQKMTSDEADIYAVTLAVTDPTLSDDDVRAWSAAGNAGDLQTIILESRNLSGLGEGAGKSGPAGV